eukprot:3633479-Pleurochrysis_carterae.AAC.1
MSPSAGPGPPAAPAVHRLRRQRARGGQPSVSAHCDPAPPPVPLLPATPEIAAASLSPAQHSAGM